MVTRTFNLVERRCKVYDREAKSMVEETFSAKKNDKKWESHIKKAGFTLLEVIEEKETEVKLGMSDEDFFRLANVIK